jgi:hypothetical protein
VQRRRRHESWSDKLVRVGNIFVDVATVRTAAQHVLTAFTVVGLFHLGTVGTDILAHGSVLVTITQVIDFIVADAILSAAAVKAIWEVWRNLGVHSSAQLIVVA